MRSSAGGPDRPAVRNFASGHTICVYQVRSTAIGSLNVGVSPSSFCPTHTPSGSECASFVATGVVNDVTIPGTTTSVDSGAQMIVNLVDTGNPSTDTISFQVSASSSKEDGLWYSSNRTGATTIEQLLGGENLFAH